MERITPQRKVEAIGGACDCTQPEASLGWAEAAAMFFVEASGKVSHARSSGQGVSKTDYRLYESAKGRAEWNGSYLQNGPERCHLIHKAWAKARESMAATRKDMDRRNFAPLFRDPTYFHGRMAVAAGASTAGGRGAHVGDSCAKGMWSQET